MPLEKGKKACYKKGKSKNISADVREDRPRNEAMAIAFEACLRAKKNESKAQRKP